MLLPSATRSADTDLLLRYLLSPYSLGQPLSDSDHTWLLKEKSYGPQGALFDAGGVCSMGIDFVYGTQLVRMAVQIRGHS